MNHQSLLPFIIGPALVFVTIFLICLGRLLKRPKFRQALLPFAGYVGLILVGGLSIFYFSTASGQSGPTLPVTKSFGDTTFIEVESGAEFVYYINYRCASITDNCESAVITDTIPSEVDFVSVSGPVSDIQSTSYNTSTRDLVIDFVDPLPAGTTGVLEIVVEFPPGTLPGTTASNTAVSSTSGGTETSGTVVAEVTGAYEMFVDKRLRNDFDDAVIGTDYTTQYDLYVCNPDDEGGVRLTNPTITDTLPAEATFVSASNGGVYNPVDHTITWTSVNSGGGLVDPVPIVDGCSIQLTVEVEFEENGPDGIQGNADDPTAGETLTNTMRLTGTPEDGSNDIDLSDPVGLIVREPYFGDGASKSSTSASSYINLGTQELPGGEVNYTIAYNNSGTITATNVIITDSLPAGQLFVTSIDVNRVVSDVNAYYETRNNPGVWVPFPDNAYSVDSTVAVTNTATANPNDIEVAADDHLTGIRWEIGEVGFGLEPWNVDVAATIFPTVPASTVIQNCVSSYAEYEDGTTQTSTNNDCENVTVIDPRAIPRVNKTASETSGLPGQVMQYVVRGYNANVAHNNLEGPITLGDFMPPEIELVVADNTESSGYRTPTAGEIAAGSWFTFTSSNGAITPTHTYTENFNADNDTLLTWTFDGAYDIPPGDYVDIGFYARIKDYTIPQTLSNEGSLLVDPSTINPLECDASDGNNAYTDTDDMDNDGNTAETGCTESEPFTVRAFLTLDSEKFTRGEPNTDWTDYDYTVTGGNVEYRMVITNTSNVTATNIVAYDIFPYSGDTGVIDTNSRDSEWGPYLIFPITDTQGLSVTIFYSQETNPCRYELLSSGPAGCVDDWSTTPPDDITSVKALKFNFCDGDGECHELAPDDGLGGGNLSFEWSMVAPNGVPDNEVAWNSFGFTADGGGLSLLPSEPIRVGIEVTPTTGLSIGDFVWLDIYGQQDDGIQQPEEPGISGLRVELWDDDLGTLVDYRTTGPNALGDPGYYEFNDVDPGNYTVRFYYPSGYTASPGNQGGDDAADSDGVTTGTDGTYGDYIETNMFTIVASDNFTIDQGLWLATDYGDAEGSYPVEAASQVNPATAARHIIDNTIYLGSGVDAETDGQPSVYAAGDDGDGNDDEDGVTFDTYVGSSTNPTGTLNIGESHTITIAHTVAVTGTINMWIDFNGDGDWDEANEKVVDEQEVSSTGSTAYSISVPGTAISGTTYARVRFSTNPGLGPTGSATDGEVEDYKINLLPAPEKFVYSTSADHTSGTDVTIGEVITYHLQIPVPEGAVDNFVVRDNLPGRLIYLESITPTTFITANTGITWTQFTVTGGPFSGGTDPIFNLGTVTNQDADTDQEFLNILMSVVVENHSGNQSGTNRNNRFTVSWDNGYEEQTSQVRVDIVEPDLTITKSLLTPLADPLDAGSVITYQLVIEHSGSTDIEAKDVMITDTFPAELTNVTVQSVVTANIAAPTTDVTANVLTVPASGSLDLPTNGVITLTVSAELDGSILSNETVTNTAQLTWTSIDGDSDEGRDGSDGSGGLNDYADDDDAVFTSDSFAISKALVSTSADHTSGANVTIGEIVTYSIGITLPEATIPSLIITDSLPTGLAFITGTIAIDDAGFAGTLPAFSIDSNEGDGDDIVLTFGAFTNPDDDNDTNNSFTLTFQARVLNTVGNNGANAPGNTTADNTATVEVGDDDPKTTPPVRVTVVEPLLNITKSIVNPIADPLDAGSVITYEIVLQHDPLSEIEAKGVLITDTFPAELTNVTVQSVAVENVGAPTTDVTTNVLTVPASGSIDLPTNGVITLTVTAEVATTIESNETVTNTAEATWTSLDGDDPTERDGSGGVDDYTTDDPADFTSDSFTISKGLVSTSADHTSGANVTIGEIVTYTIGITVPEASFPSLVITDSLPTGLAFITGTVNIDDASFAGTVPAPAISSNEGDGDDIVLTFGSFSNPDDDNVTNDSFSITFQARVLNTVGNNGANAPGNTTADNTATAKLGDDDPKTTPPVRVTIVEPLLNITKSIVNPIADPLDAGSVITYQIVLEHDALSEIEAKGVLITDTFPAELTNVTVQSVAVENVGAPTTDVTTNVLTVPSAGTLDLPTNGVITITITAEVATTIESNETVTNTAEATWTSLDGDDPTERDGSGGVDDYSTDDPAVFTSDSFTISKGLLTTSADHTSGANVTIGEIVTYTIGITLPEATFPSLVVTDSLPTGLAFVTGTIAIEDGSFAGTVPAPAISSNEGDGDDIVLTFGAFSNPDDDNVTNDSFSITFQARVLNTVGNNGANAPSNTTADNTATVEVGDDDPKTTPPVRVTIVEPLLTITKNLVTPLPDPLDAGSVITYEIVIEHDPLSEIEAKDVLITDTFPSELINVTVESVDVSGVGAPTTDVTTNVLTVPASGSLHMPVGSVVTLTVSAELDLSILPSELVTNTAEVTWTSLEGTDTGERDGSGGVDDYSDNDSDTFTSDAPSLVKALVSTSADHTTGTNVTIGEIVTYSIDVTLPEATINSIVITDNLPAGLAFITGTVNVDDSSLNGTLPAHTVDSNEGSGDDVIVSFGTFAIPNDGDPNNNTFQVTFQAVVLDVVGNVGLNPPGQTVLTNTATVQIGSQPPQDSNSVDVTVVEPRLEISKAFDREQAAPNSQVTVTLQVTNTGTSTAFDVIIDDPIDSSEFVTLTEGTTPAGFTYAEVPSGDDSIVRYTGGPIAVGATVEFTFFAVLSDTLAASPPNITNVVTVTQHTTLDSTADDGDDSEERDEPDVNASDDLVVVRHDLVLDKDDGKTAVRDGETITYTLTISNVGNSVAPNVTVTDTVPVSTTFSGPAGWSCPASSPAGTVCTYSLGDIAAGNVVTVEYAVTVDTPLPSFADPITNTATTDTDGSRGPDPTPGDNTDDDVDTILATIGDLVWLDEDGDGIKDGGELGVGGITVTLYTSGGAVISTTTTAGDGSYLFEGITPQNVYVEFTLPISYTFSPADQGGDDTVDSDANTTTGRTATTTLSDGEIDLSWDAGIYVPASIGDFIWNDTDADGIQDGGEVGIGGITVTLYTSGGAVISTTTTAADGSYLFDGIQPQDVYLEITYPPTLTVSPQDQGGDDSVDSDFNPTTGRTATTTLTSGENDLSWDAGLYESASIGDFVWLDTDGDGIQDGGETGIGGITVTLYTSGGAVITTTVTAGDGSYLFDDLVPQDVYVEFTYPPTYTLSLQDQGADDAADSDVDPTTGRTITTTLSSGENDLTWDAGLYIPASLGDLVWLDTNADGIKDVGESGIGGITVTLYASDNSVITTTTTAPDGSYLFENLRPQDVYVIFTPPPTLTISIQDQGGDDLVDSDANPITGQTATTTLESGENDLSWDAGVHELASIGDYVWLDTNADGIQDGLESGVGGITVTLLASDGSVISTTVTAGDGSYLFSGLTPQDVYISFTVPISYSISPQDQGGDDAVDSDVNPTTGRTATTTLSSGENDLSWDLGIYTSTGIGDFVWYDRDADGIQDVGEEGLYNVQVDLYTSLGVFVTTTTTALDGSYSFTDLVPNDYYVDVVPPTGYGISPRDQGGDDAADSDIDPTTGQTAVTTLSSGEYDPTWDAGLTATPAAIGDTVWLDADQDGIQDGDELGIEGVTVNLYDFDDNLIDTTTTASDGGYLFSDLPPGDYYIEVIEPVGYTVTDQDQGGDDAADSDINNVTGQTAVTTLSPGEIDLTWDAGLYTPPATLGDRIWLDVDQDGIQDGDEFGVSGVTVNLLNGSGDVIATTTTDASGNYLFENLPPGDYAIDVVPPGGYTITPQDQGGDDAADSDIDPTTGESGTVTLTAGEDNRTLDGGLYIQPASLGNYVWLDADLNGTQDFNEDGLSGVLVELFSSDGTRIDSTSTDPSGFYLFDNLPPGDYYIETSPLNGYAFTGQDLSGDDATDSDVDVNTGRSITTTLSAGENDMTWDIGLVPSNAELGDYVWEDRDGDGLPDADEPGVPNVTVNLYDGSGNLLDTTTTDADGLYRFRELDPGDYFVEFVPPIGYEFTTQDAGGDDTADSDADVTTGRTIVTTLTPGESDVTWDAGLVRSTIDLTALASLGNYVWADVDSDGIQDANEDGVANVEVTLYDITGTVVATTTTDTNGLYTFDNLTPDDYYVGFTLPVSYTFTTQDSGGDDTIDSDANVGTGLTISTTLTAGENDTTWDAGIIPQQDPPALASLGNYVWRDTNEDGLQDLDEIGVADVTVRLYDSGGTLQGITTTDADGYYGFEDLTPGDYYVEFTAPTGYTITLQNQGADDWLDSDADPITGQTATTTLIAGENDLSWDAGLIEELDPALAAIGNFVWEDLDKDGIQDAGEPGIPNVQVNLYTSAGVLTGTTTTDLNGLYEFRDLTPGDYYIEVIPPVGYDPTTQDSGADNLDSDIDPATGQTITTTLIAGENDPTWDAGLIRTEPDPLLASLGDFVWLDSDRDGIQEAGEPGVPNVVVRLFDIGNTNVATTTTDADGLYEFTDLTPGDYYVEFSAPAGYTMTLQNQGGDSTLDSDADPTTGQTVPTTLTAGENDITWDAGLYEVLSPTLAAIGNYVWFDSDQDGLQDIGEPGIEDVEVWLYDASNTVILTTTTDADGLYQFTDLTPGDYYVEFVLPEDYTFSDQDQGADDGIDSDPNIDETSPAFGQTIPTTLTAGENDTTWDAGMFIPTPPATASIGDYVWLDANLDGLQGNDEDGILGVTVNLYNAAGTLLDTTTTDAVGFYQFVGLEPGDYFVEVVPPLGYAVTLQDAGSDELEDSDIDLDTGRTVTTTLTAAENDPTWDAGLYPALRLGNLVWYDSNNDGLFDAGTETGIPGVVVELLDENGLPFTHPVTGVVMTTTTDANGNYEFTDLPEGTYIVQIPISNFDENDDILFGFSSSRDDALVDPVTDPDVDPTDQDDDGINAKFPAETGIRSNPVTLEVGNEPTTDTADEDGSLPDDNSNLTVDFGFFELLTLGNQIWFDTDSDGRYDTDEVGVPAGVILNLLDGNGDPVINPETGRPITTTTGISGTYQFTNLYPGDYQINVDASAFQPGGPLEGYVSSAGSTDPDDDSDLDDNGEDSSDPTVDGITSASITLNYHAEPDGGADGDDNDNTNFTVDFGVVTIPTAVELIFFEGSWRGGRDVSLHWKTGAEIDHLLFVVKRNDRPNYSTANEIGVRYPPTSTGFSAGSTYQLDDTTPDHGTYYYWLVDIDTNLVETVHGPIEVTTSSRWNIYLPMIAR